MKILLGATIALLLGALAVSWQGMNEGVKNTPPDELARLDKQIKELRAEQDKLQREKQMQEIRNQPVAAQPSSAEMDELKRQLALAKQDLQDAAAKPVPDKNLDNQEGALLDGRSVEDKDGELRRARLIKEALLVGRVQEYVVDQEHPELGAFVILDIVMPEQVQEGTVLAIRRKTGILGQLKISQITPEGAVANPMPGFGPINPVQGDELILPPLY